MKSFGNLEKFNTHILYYAKLNVEYFCETEEVDYPLYTVPKCILKLNLRNKLIAKTYMDN